MESTSSELTARKLPFVSTNFFELMMQLVTELSEEISKALETHEINQRRAADGKNVANVVLLRGCGARLRVLLLRFRLD